MSITATEIDSLRTQDFTPLAREVLRKLFAARYQSSADLGTGTADNTVFLRGDQTWSNTLNGDFIINEALGKISIQSTSVGGTAGPMIEGRLANGASGLQRPLTLNGISFTGTLLSQLRLTQGGTITASNMVVTTGVSLQAINGAIRTSTNYEFPQVFSLGTVGATCTVDWLTNGGRQALTMTSATASTATFTAPNAPCTLRLWITAGAVAALFTFPGTAKGITTITVLATKTSLFDIEWDGVNYWISNPVVNA